MPPFLDESEKLLDDESSDRRSVDNVSASHSEGENAFIRRSSKSEQSVSERGRSTSGHGTPTNLPSKLGTQSSTKHKARRGEKEPLSRHNERQFLEQHFGHLRGAKHTSQGVEFTLVDFRIHEKDTENDGYESLHEAAVCENKYCFDGKLSHADGSHTYVQDVRIWRIAIDNLAGGGNGERPQNVSCADAIFLETDTSKLFNCYYRLARPHQSYKSHYEHFVWLADFLKHLSDYLTWAASTGRLVKLEDLRCDFVQKLGSWYEYDPTFQEWHLSCGWTVDFRRHLTCGSHIKFIHWTISTANNKDEDMLQHPLWKEAGAEPELKPNLNAIPRTLVTSHASDCFLPSFPQWGPRKMNLLDTIVVSPAVQELQRERQIKQELGTKHTHSRSEHFHTEDGVAYSVVDLLIQ